MINNLVGCRMGLIINVPQSQIDTSLQLTGLNCFVEAQEHLNNVSITCCMNSAPSIQTTVSLSSAQFVSLAVFQIDYRFVPKVISSAC